MMRSLRGFTQEAIYRCHRACLIVLNHWSCWGFSFLRNHRRSDSLSACSLWFVTWWVPLFPWQRLSITAASTDIKMRVKTFAILWILYSRLSNFLKWFCSMYLLMLYLKKRNNYYKCFAVRLMWMSLLFENDLDLWVESIHKRSKIIKLSWVDILTNTPY